MINARVICDSISPSGIRLTTFQLKYPRLFHAELLTHRVFSRNSSSSRAVPWRRVIAMAKEDGFPFVHVGKNRPGMQAIEEISPEMLEKFRREWFELRDIVAEYTTRWAEEYQIHKQVVNRAFEPFTHIHTVLSSTEWDNFFGLRAHDAAQPEFGALAIAIRNALNASDPTALTPEEWHLPYILDEERPLYSLEELREFSAARCARVSYVRHDGTNPVPSEDVELFWRLVGEVPIHASPTEHQATPDTKLLFWWRHRKMHGNFTGWIQHRKLVEFGLITPRTLPAA